MAKIIKKEIFDDDEQRLIREGKLSDKKSSYYVDGEALQQEFVKYHEQAQKALAEGKPRPKMNDKIGWAIMQICTRRCRSKNYYGYTDSWKEEMIDHAIRVCATKAHKFDPINYSNPFAYITQIADNAIKEQIKIERRHLYVRYKMYDESRGMLADMTDDNINEDDLQMASELDDVYKNRLDYISKFEISDKERREKKSESGKKRKTNPDNDSTVDMSQFFN